MSLPKQSDKIEKVKKWLKELTQDGAYGMLATITDTGWLNNEYRYRVDIHTVLHTYSISATDRLDLPGYLGCIACLRYSYPGEDWHRGNDLPDGHLTYETWQRIKVGIIRYELDIPSVPQHSHAITSIAYTMLKHFPIEMLPELFVSEDRYIRAAAKKVVELRSK